MNRFVLRLIGILILFGMGLLILIPSVQRKRLDADVRKLMLQTQEGLQNYLIAEELYPTEAMRGAVLLAFLRERGFLKEEAMKNPWADGNYERAEEVNDWMRYRTDDLAESYQLTVYFAGSEEVQLRLDSVENHSLE